MPIYHYLCHDCEQTLTKKLNVESLSNDDYIEHILFETSHTMSPTKQELEKAIICPRCNGINCEKSPIGLNVTGYIRGNGYLDKAGVSRDMNLFKLTKEDPYAQYRVTGEVDHLKSQLKKQGQHNPKPKSFVMSDKKKSTPKTPKKTTS